MWPRGYWPDSYWSKSYWPDGQTVPAPPVSINAGTFSPFMDQDYDSTGALYTTPTWVFNNPPKQPEQVRNSPHLVGGFNAKTIESSPPSPTFLRGHIDVHAIEASPSIRDKAFVDGGSQGSINLKGSAVVTKFVEGGVGNS